MILGVHGNLKMLSWGVKKAEFLPSLRFQHEHSTNGLAVADFAGAYKDWTRWHVVNTFRPNSNRLAPSDVGAPFQQGQNFEYRYRTKAAFIEPLKNIEGLIMQNWIKNMSRINFR